MQMYLFRDTAADRCDFRSINGGDDSGVVWHEYTHGLSNRLVTNADGTGALSSAHSGAMGEGWSDWYASDLQVRDGLKTDDRRTPGEIDIGDYSDADPARAAQPGARLPGQRARPRSAPAARTPAPAATRSATSARSSARPEVHADGEIWAETLWDLRQALCGCRRSPRALVTDGMRLSPPEPSMLDMRNAILAAEQATFGGRHDDAIWEVFRVRGMGYFAAATDGADTEPVEDFTPPPAPAAPRAPSTGVVTDADSGLPLAGVRVGFGGHTSRPDFADYPPTRRTRAGATRSPTCPPAATRSSRSSRPAGYDAEVVARHRDRRGRHDDARHRA